MTERQYGHNEIICRVPRPVKRRFMQICNDQNKRPDELGGDIIRNWVFYYTPPLSQHKSIRWLNKKMEDNKKGIYLLFTGICFMLIGAIFITVMIYHRSFIGWASMFCLVVIVFFFAKIFFMLSKMDDK